MLTYGIFVFSSLLPSPPLPPLQMGLFGLPEDFVESSNKKVRRKRRKNAVGCYKQPIYTYVFLSFFVSVRCDRGPPPLHLTHLLTTY